MGAVRGLRQQITVCLCDVNVSVGCASSKFLTGMAGATYPYRYHYLRYYSTIADTFTSHVI